MPALSGRKRVGGAAGAYSLAGGRRCAVGIAPNLVDLAAVVVEDDLVATPRLAAIAARRGNSNA
jgi:hypothetical protein